jgi:hypothetical protein
MVRRLTAAGAMAEATTPAPAWREGRYAGMDYAEKTRTPMVSSCRPPVASGMELNTR